MKTGNLVKLKYPSNPGCLPDVATVLNTWWDHTGDNLHIEIHCPKLGGAFTVRADAYEVVHANKTKA